MNRVITSVALIASIVAFSTVAEARGGSSGGHSSHSSHGPNIYSGTGSNSSSHYTHGYTRQNGTYVAPHYSTNPNGTRMDNYEAKGNVNPYTGKVGTKLVDR